MQKKIWTGPALSNPRNVRTQILTTKLYDLPVEVMNALIGGKINEIPNTVFFDFDDDVMFLGTIEVSDIAHSPADHEYRFRVAPHPNPGSRVWRAFHEIVAIIQPGGDVTVTRIDVAPDDPNDDAEHAPASPA